MPNVIIYEKDYCPFCQSAKALFDRKKVKYNRIDVTAKDFDYEKLQEKTGMRTVPQIFVNDILVGGYQELVAMEKSGELDKLLTRK